MSSSSFSIYRLEPSELPIWQIPQPPQHLYVQGSQRALALLNSLPKRGLGIVGTRNPTPRTAQWVHKTVLSLAGSDLVILSGFARGIDATAHQAALLAGLPTIAVLGAGLRVDYPSQHRKLRQSILEADGLLVSEFEHDDPVYKGNFIRRNRIIAGWAKAVWVAEARVKSGALNTAEWAREQNRLCFATPCFPGDPILAGNQRLLDDECAFPLWGPHSLGTVWLELATRSVQPNLPGLTHRTSTRDEGWLARQVEEICLKRGSAEVQDLLDKALAQDWSPGRFFQALQRALSQQLVTEKNGLLLIPV